MKTIDGVTIYERELNHKLSTEIYEEFREFIQEQQCYKNIYYVLSQCIHKFKEQGWKIGYGYFSDVNEHYFRHCYIIDEQGTVIDPTYMLFNHSVSTKSPVYWTFTSLDVNEYLALVEKYDNTPSLLKHYESIHRTLFSWGLKQKPQLAFWDY
ncbi:hypothetical protein [Priestia megaterium]|uniref:hypothetical protein n=1 Tax=Priestia megaterium TaxID=1404 RepID=UPI000BF5C1B5|nr:hypothetical protein [Priestia megaterium]PFR88897.1 hypothetical protein COK39_25640 [Priestia megaterium]